MATNAAADGNEHAGHEAWRRLREWAPVVGVLVAVLALFVALAILFGAALGRMETRLRADAATDKAEVLTQIESVRTDVRSLGADVSADMRALREELAPVGDILKLLQARQ